MTPPSRREWLRSFRAVVLGVVISAALLYGAIRSVPIRDLGDAIREVSLPILSLSLVIKLANLGLLSLRTHLLVRRQRLIPARVLLASHLVGFAANNVLPFRAGELVRIDYLARNGSLPRSACLPVVVAERLLDMAALGVIFLAAAPFVTPQIPLERPLYMSLVLVAAGFVALLAVRRRPAPLVALLSGAAGLLGGRAKAFVQSKMTRVLEGVAALPSGGAAIPVVLLSAAIWTLPMISVSVWLWAFGLDLPWYAPMLVVFFLAFGLALPAAPGHVGTYHYFASAALMVAGLGRVDALSVAVVGHAVAIVPFTAVGAPIAAVAYARQRRTSRGGAKTAPGPVSGASGQGGVVR